ncbi:MAG TPA: hypothetical protein VH183_01650 [Burkholderiaceae bacterium]|nr:hypothetical protein [Burkholderiaceae bacterium]
MRNLPSGDVSSRAAGWRTFTVIYLLFLLGFGVGYISITPPFEGFDETAHYSSLREIADTGRIPVYGKGRLDQSVVDYKGPIHYDTGTPPFDRGLVYPKFFAQPALVAHYLEYYRRPGPHVAYQASSELNWQAQHPPLYYLLFARLLPLLDRFSFTAQIFLLRLTSFVVALCGVAFGLLAVDQAGAPSERNASLVGFLVYPILLPMFFPEFARIGNDSLCLLFVGLAAYFLALWLKDERSPIKATALGVTLGLGLLTKAFFLPITLALGIFLASRLLLDGAKRAIRAERFKRSAVVFLTAVLVGGGWYVYKLVMYGDVTGADYAIRLERQGGMMAGLESHFSFSQLIRGALMPLVSYQWVGTWSVTRVPEVFQVPMVALAAWIALAYVRRLKGRSLADPAWLPVWLFSLFVLGLYWHVLIGIALYNLGAAGGWYMHILMPWAAPAIGLAVASILSYRLARPLFVALLAYAFAFHVFVLWAQLSLFTGCATKGPDKYYAFSGNALCFDQARLIWDRLAVLGYPLVAIAGFGLGLVCLACLILRLARNPAVENR